nr:heavy metal-associated isoprenylated plant protein 19-like [Ipomoea trifida]
MNGDELIVSALNLSYYEGVEKFTTDMNENKAVVIGHMDPSKVLKKLKKKTGKRVEMVVAAPENEEEAEEDDAAGREAAVNGSSVEPAPEMIQEYAGECSGDSAVYTMFSDENPNACVIM